MISKIYFSLLFSVIYLLYSFVQGQELTHCWKQTYGNGAGIPTFSCNENEEKNGLLCYPKCSNGYQGVGPVCWSVCPPGYIDTGAFCSPRGWDFFRKLTIAKKTYGRGAGTPLKCVNLLQDGALCYPKCQDGFKNIGPVCWQICHGDYNVDCGPFCSIRQSHCALTLIEMGTTAMELVIQITKLDPLKVLERMKQAEKSLGIQLCNDQMKILPFTNQTIS